MRHIVFDRKLSQFSVQALLEELGQANAPRHVYVDSPGGQFEFFSCLAPAIERRGIITLAGDVRSAAVILFLLGCDRKAFPDSVFFFHEVRALVDEGGEVTIADLEMVQEYDREMSGRRHEFYKEWLRKMRAAQNWFLYFLREKTGLPQATFLNLMRREVTLSAQEAVRYGIAHEVVSKSLLSA